MTGVADPITPAGSTQRLVNAYAEQYAAAKEAAVATYKKDKTYASPMKKVLTLWSTTPASYTTFDATTGAPITTTAAAPGTNHCNFTSAQYLVVAKNLVKAGTDGAFMSGSSIRTLVRKAKNLSIDPDFSAPLMKYYE
jgi:hypothetical protein